MKLNASFFGTLFIAILFSGNPQSMAKSSYDKFPAPKKGGTFIDSATMTPITLNPILATNVDDMAVSGWLFMNLMERDGANFNRLENVRRSVEQEYQELLAFVHEHSKSFAIAKNAREARAILKENKTVLVLSLEGAWGTLETAEDFQRWIEDRGVAIVTPVHLTPDDLGGNALMGIVVGLANSTVDFIKSAWSTRGACLKNFCKSMEGFTSKGEHTLDELLTRQVWIDFAHSNEIEVKSMIEKFERETPANAPGAKKNGKSLPLLVTHTQHRDYFPYERALGEPEISYIHQHDGIVGIIPTQYMMPLALKNAKTQAMKTHPGEGAPCISGLEVFRSTIFRMIEVLGSTDRVTLGSDINAPLDGLSPLCENSTSSEKNSELFSLGHHGFYTYSQWNALTQFISPPQKDKTSWADATLEHFLKLWAQVRP